MSKQSAIRGTSCVDIIGEVPNAGELKMILACACRGPWTLAVDCCIQSDIVAIQSHGEAVCLYAV